MKNIITITGSLLILSFGVPIIFYQSWSFLYWMDSLFYIGLGLLIIGGAMLLIEGQFFSAFIRSSKHFFKTISKKEQIIQQIEGKKEERIHAYRKSFPSAKIYWFAGLSFCLISLLFSTFIVYLGR
ncbi:uncharacterized protein DUF3899 [Bacillus oleivorans]|uniref:Uncharacterized protein DUF3899 n=1 Tax=Bacillus oleivorans TaxID=1448271 RepID=A0A285CI41_9BACI|nr:DUF3899 domain-containing protein [Bacillus oleivorans]SNX67264.1 uncharacterized protein DUF3899 [Bacillus oleivorans]